LTFVVEAGWETIDAMSRGNVSIAGCAATAAKSTAAQISGTGLAAAGLAFTKAGLATGNDASSAVEAAKRSGGRATAPA